MSRTRGESNATIIKRRLLRPQQSLREAWLCYGYLYTVLSPPRRWQVHRFYRSAERLSKEELIVHRQVITAEDPTLPSWQGLRTYAGRLPPGTSASQGSERPFLLLIMRQAAAQTSRPYLRTWRRIRLSAETRPEVDDGAYVQAMARISLNELGLQ